MRRAYLERFGAVLICERHPHPRTADARADTLSQARSDFHAGLTLEFSLGFMRGLRADRNGAAVAVLCATLWTQGAKVPMTDAASLLDAQPVFPSSDLSRTEIFYTEKLGFAVGDRHADWLKLDRDGLTLHFSLVPDLDPKTKMSHVYIRVRGVGSLYESSAQPT